MKLIFVIKRLESAVGGAERVLCNICSELAERGHDITIVTFDMPGSISFYPLNKKIKKLDLGIGNSKSHATIIDSIQRIYALRKYIKNIQPDIVIGFMHSSYVLLAIAMFGLNIKIIGSEHIVPEHYYSRPLEFILIYITTPFISKITVLSQQILDRYPKLLRIKMVVQVNPIIVKLQLNNIKVNKYKKVLLNIGRLDKQKDQKTLILAFSKIANKHPNWVLHIYGEGHLESMLYNLIRELNMENKVYLKGVTNDIESVYKAADAFVISSRYESFGLVTAEAMAHGLPVVGFSDCPGTNELIINEVNGLLVEPRSDRKDSLSESLDYLLSDCKLRTRLGNSAKQSITGKFSLQTVTDSWEKMLVDVYSSDKHRSVNRLNDSS